MTASRRPPGIDLEEISAQCFPRIHRAALVLTGNPWDADDLAQETFLVLARDGWRFEGRSSVYTWLYGVLLNLERRRRRNAGLRERKLRVLWGRETLALPPMAPPAEAALEAEEWKRSLWSLVARLPEGQRQALVLRFSEQLRYDEIAEVLECPLGTVKSRIFNGLAALRAALHSQHSADAAAQALEVPEDLTDVV
jgi:RNA polymerase sigma-70 factor (ECF subfamily)